MRVDTAVLVIGLDVNQWNSRVECAVTDYEMEGDVT
jgi:hypothetical protein